MNHEEKRNRIRQSLLKHPDWSDSRIAKAAEASPHTVKKVRAELEATGAVPQLARTEGADGKKRAALKPWTVPKEAITVLLEAHPITGPIATDREDIAEYLPDTEPQAATRVTACQTLEAAIDQISSSKWQQLAILAPLAFLKHLPQKPLTAVITFREVEGVDTWFVFSTDAQGDWEFKVR